MTSETMHSRATFQSWVGVLTGLCFLVLVLSPASALASPQPPANDNFLDSDNLNAPARPLPTVNTLSSSVDTSAATLQQNVLSACGELLCPSGPAEQSTCQGVSYGKTVWYDFYPDHNGEIEIRTDGIPNVIALYTYDPRSLIPTQVNCAEGSKYRRNELSENVRRGVDYTVQIGGRNSIGGPLHVLFNYVDRTHLTVPPFLTSALIQALRARGGNARLLKFRFIGVAGGETISAACGFCARGNLRERSRRGNTVALEGSKPTIDRRSRLLIAATAPAQIGRFKVYAYRPRGRTLVVVAQGCLAPGVTRVTVTDAEHLAALPRIPCPVRLVNPIGGEYVFWRGPDNHLREKWYSGTTWSPTLRLKFGGLASAPSVAVHAKGEQDVFWRSTHGRSRGGVVRRSVERSRGRRRGRARIGAKRRGRRLRQGIRLLAGQERRAMGTEVCTGILDAPISDSPRRLDRIGARGGGSYRRGAGCVLEGHEWQSLGDMDRWAQRAVERSPGPRRRAAWFRAEHRIRRRRQRLRRVAGHRPSAVGEVVHSWTVERGDAAERRCPRVTAGDRRRGGW